MSVRGYEVEERIIRVLGEETGVFRSGEGISTALGISRAAVWKHIRKLREEGFDVEAVPSKGYALKRCPDELYPHLVRAGLGTSVFGKKDYLYRDSVPSTNSMACAHAGEGASEGAVFVAREQGAGRGRLGRRWISPPGGIYFSLVLRPALAPSELGALPLVAGLALSDAIENVTGVRPYLKWPNDILVDGYKVAGILMEMKAEADMVDFVVLGIGINVDIDTGQLPASARNMNDLSDSKVSKVGLFRAVLEHLERDYMFFREEGVGRFLARYRQLSDTIGKNVTISRGGKRVSGIAEGVAPSGALLVRTDTDGTIAFFSGDVTLR